MSQHSLRGPVAVQGAARIEALTESDVMGMVVISTRPATRQGPGGWPCRHRPGSVSNVKVHALSLIAECLTYSAHATGKCLGAPRRSGAAQYAVPASAMTKKS